MRQEIGALLHLYVEEIEPLFPTEAHQFLIAGAAKAINKAGERNWIPVIVKQTGAETFQAIANIFVLAAAQEAGLDKVWCIIADESDFVQDCSQLLSQEATPKINLSTATRDEIKLGLDYLINRSNNPLPSVKLSTALDKIDKPDRKYWGKALKEVTTLKCGITAGKKLNIFKEVFYTTPQLREEPEKTEKTEEKNIHNMNVSELRAEAKKRGFSGYTKLKKAELVALLS
jgi:hypothetical protein